MYIRTELKRKANSATIVVLQHLYHGHADRHAEHMQRNNGPTV
jgi:hypothetical protein